MKSISLFVDNGTYLTKIHPFTKLMYIATAISIPLITGRLWMFGVLIAVSLCILASGKILRKTVPLIAFSFTILLTIFLIHGLFNQKNTNMLFRTAQVLPGGSALCTANRAEHFKYASLFCGLCAFHKAVRACR